MKPTTEPLLFDNTVPATAPQPAFRLVGAKLGEPSGRDFCCNAGEVCAKCGRGMALPPFQPSSPESFAGAVAAAPSAKSQCDLLERVYAASGAMGLTDLEAVDSYNRSFDVTSGRMRPIERNVINARRAELIGPGIVKKFGVRKNPESGVNNGVYGLVRCEGYQHPSSPRKIVHEQGVED